MQIQKIERIVVNTFARYFLDADGEIVIDYYDHTNPEAWSNGDFRSVVALEMLRDAKIDIENPDVIPFYVTYAGDDGRMLLAVAERIYGVEMKFVFARTYGA